MIFDRVRILYATSYVFYVKYNKRKKLSQNFLSFYYFIIRTLSNYEANNVLMVDSYIIPTQMILPYLNLNWRLRLRWIKFLTFIVMILKEMIKSKSKGLKLTARVNVCDTLIPDRAWSLDQQQGYEVDECAKITQRWLADCSPAFSAVVHARHSSDR